MTLVEIWQYLIFKSPIKLSIDSTDFEGKFEFRPLEPGYGLTVGNALRRVLFSLEGYAITSVRIEGVDMSSLIAGVGRCKEIILNLKCTF